MNWQIYIIQCSDGSLYTGVSTDPQRRFREHRSGGPRAAKFFRGRRAERLAYVETGLTRSEACRREWEIKQLGRAGKLRLIAGQQ
ncbi:MAG: GIY-YIG nuclease family protein [Xanthomonadales bacterium]|nr:GIY-YIG nuclease family protein [Xanthomonadales bacterium]